MNIQLDDHVSGGYFLTQAITTPDFCTRELLPPEIMTCSGCFAPFAPDVWAIQWTTCSQEEREQQAAKFGILPADLPQVMAWITSRLDATIGWPHVFLSLTTAREFCQQFVNGKVRGVLLGIGLPRQYVERFLGDEKPGASEGTPGVYQAVSGHHALQPGGQVLGYEILGYEYGTFHSWLCNRLEHEVHRHLQIRPNAHGLVGSLSEAERAATYCARDDVKAEPALWLPWLIVQYPLE
jgi:hypothetical protein